jgi:hypothetical protein
MQEVGGSIPPGSTSLKVGDRSIFRPASPSSRGLGHIPFTDATGVRIPVGTPLHTESVRKSARKRRVGLRCELLGIGRAIKPLLRSLNFLMHRVKTSIKAHMKALAVPTSFGGASCAAGALSRDRAGAVIG